MRANYRFGTAGNQQIVVLRRRCKRSNSAANRTWYSPIVRANFSNWVSKKLKPLTLGGIFVRFGQRLNFINRTRESSVMNRVAQTLFFGSLLSLAFILSGCGSGMPKGYVSGKVTLQNGNDPAGLLVRFINASDGVGATGVVQQDGRYSLKSKGESGVPIGSYKIAVTAQVRHMTDLEVVEFMKLSGAEQREVEKERRAKSQLVPKMYRSTETSDLSYEVVSGSQTHDIVIGGAEKSDETTAEKSE